VQKPVPVMGCRQKRSEISQGRFLGDRAVRNGVSVQKLTRSNQKLAVGNGTKHSDRVSWGLLSRNGPRQPKGSDFKDDLDRSRFMETLGEACGMTGVARACFCPAEQSLSSDA
jgi:hypothetical protein